jgi:hypothetical protein
MARKEKSLPKWLQDELVMLGWKEVGQGMRKGYVWVKDGVMISIVPSTMGRMYHVTREKMSERESMFIQETQLLALIEGDSDV